MKKLLIGLLALVSISSFANSDLNCNSSDLHQKDQAICTLKNSIENNTNIEISQQVNSLANEGLKPSGEYTALFLGGNNSSWTYAVSVDFYNTEKFQSIVAIIKTSQKEKASVKEVLSSSRIKNLRK